MTPQILVVQAGNNSIALGLDGAGGAGSGSTASSNASSGGTGGGGGGGTSLGLGMGGGPGSGGGSNSGALLGGGHQFDHPFLLAASFHCPLTDERFYVSDLVGGNIEDSSTLKCPRHPFGMNPASMQLWQSSHSPTQSNGDVDFVQAEDTNPYEFACVPMQMRCAGTPGQTNFYSPQQLGYNLLTPQSWSCPLHHVGIAASLPYLLNGIQTYDLGCTVPPQEEPLELAKTEFVGFDLPNTATQGSLHHSHSAGSDDGGTNVVFFTGGYFFVPPSSSVPKAAVEVAIKDFRAEVSALPAGSEIRGGEGSWSSSGFPRGEGPGANGSNGNAGDFPGGGGFFTSGGGGGGPAIPSSDVVASASTESATSAVGAATTSMAAAPVIPSAAQKSEPLTISGADAVEVAGAIAVFGLAAALVMGRLAKSRQENAGVLRRMRTTQVVPAGIKVVPVILAQPRKRVDWSRYRHLVTDIVEDAVFAVRGWVAPQQSNRPNRLAKPIEQEPIVYAETASTNRIAKKELADALAS